MWIVHSIWEPPYHLLLWIWFWMIKKNVSQTPIPVLKKHKLVLFLFNFFPIYNLFELKLTQNLTYRPSTATSRWLPIKRSHFLVTSGHEKSRDVISSHVTATSCELQPCRGPKVPKTWLIGLLQQLPGDSRWNDVTSGHFRSREVTSRHFLSRGCHLLRATAL